MTGKQCFAPHAVDLPLRKKGVAHNSKTSKPEWLLVTKVLLYKKEMTKQCKGGGNILS